MEKVTRNKTFNFIVDSNMKQLMFEKATRYGTSISLFCHIILKKYIDDNDSVEQIKTDNITIATTSDIIDKITRNSQKHNITKSEYVRRIIMDVLDNDDDMTIPIDIDEQCIAFCKGIFQKNIYLNGLKIYKQWVQLHPEYYDKDIGEKESYKKYGFIIRQFLREMLRKKQLIRISNLNYQKVIQNETI